MPARAPAHIWPHTRRSTDILVLLLQIPLRGAMTTGIGGSEQHWDRRATRPDVYRVMGPAQLSADSAKDPATQDSKRPLKRPLSTLSQTSHSSPPRRSKTSDTRTAKQLSAEKTPLINKTEINKARALHNPPAPLSTKLKHSSGNVSMPERSVAGSSRSGKRGRRGGRGRAQQTGFRTKDSLWVPRTRNVGNNARTCALQPRSVQWQ